MTKRDAILGEDPVEGGSADVSARSQHPAEAHIDRWRARARSAGVAEAIVLEIECELREQVAAVGDTVLDADETFLIALRRTTTTDTAARDVARSYAEALLSTSAGPSEDHAQAHTAAEFWVMLACAVAAALAVKLPLLFGLDFGGDGDGLYARNLSLFVLPFLALYFTWKRRPNVRVTGGVAAVFIAAALFANVYPFVPGGSTEVLTAIHLPVALWLVVGVIHSSGDWLSAARRMEYVRFTGEWLISFALIALGGGVLVALTVGIFDAIGLDAEPLVEQWILSCAMGAVIVAAWLVETRRNLIGGMAPMLARVFTPLFALMLVVLLVGVVSTLGVELDREVLILFDLLLVVVLALVLYAVSAREPLARPGVFDRIQLVLVVCALGVDVFALLNIAGRLTEYGFSANRTAALGLNLILLVNLAWSAVLVAGFVRARRTFEPLERWQMRYLPVYALWAAVVVVVFPPLFGFA